MRRKWLAYFLACAMLLSALGGCGTQQGTEPQTASSEIPTSSEASTPEEASSQTSAPEEEGDWSTLVSVDWEENNVDLDTGINMTYLTCGPEDGIPLLLDPRCNR